MLSTAIMQNKNHMLNKTQLFGKRRWEVREDIWTLWQGIWNWHCLRLSNQEMEASYKVVLVTSRTTENRVSIYLWNLGRESQWTLGVGDGREAWRAAIHGVAKSWTLLSDWIELNWTELIYIISFPSWASITCPWYHPLDHHRLTAWAPCAIQQLPTTIYSYLFYTL